MQEVKRLQFVTRRSLLPCHFDRRERAAAYRGGCVVGFHSRATAIFYGSDYAAKEIFPMRPKRSVKRFPQNTEAQMAKHGRGEG
jgi:hypothetical protein